MWEGKGCGKKRVAGEDTNFKSVLGIYEFHQHVEKLSFVGRYSQQVPVFTILSSHGNEAKNKMILNYLGYL